MAYLSGGKQTTINSTITELYSSRSTNSWTILETDTNGISCATIGGKESKYIMNNNY